jgi:hypothetical protein
LDAPGEWAARTLEGATGRFALGPLPEVAASTHAWGQLAPYLQGTPQAAIAAHERVVRGEDLSKDPVALSLPAVLDLPLVLADWEPPYAVPEYQADKVTAPMPRVPLPRPVAGSALERAGTAGAYRETAHRAVEARGGVAREVVSALEDLAGAWTTESNGRAEAVAVVGGALDAVRSLGAQPTELAELAVRDALALMAWAGASGGAHGRRRGTAAGRFGAWGVLAALGRVPYDWAANENVLAEVAARTKWCAWGSGEPVTGWSLRLALEGPAEEAYALTAVDAF